jgi:hypothetical protein
MQLGIRLVGLLDFASTVIPGFNLLEVQDFCSLLGMYVFRNGASSSAKEGSVFLHRRYECCTVDSVLVYQCCQGVQVTMDPYILCHCSALSNIHARYQRFPVNEDLCDRLCLNLCNYSITAVNQLTVVGLTEAKIKIPTSFVWLYLMQYYVHFNLHSLGLLLPSACVLNNLCV